MFFASREGSLHQKSHNVDCIELIFQNSHFRSSLRSSYIRKATNKCTPKMSQGMFGDHESLLTTNLARHPAWKAGLLRLVSGNKIKFSPLFRWVTEKSLHGSCRNLKNSDTWGGALGYFSRVKSNGKRGLQAAEPPRIAFSFLPFVHFPEVRRVRRMIFCQNSVLTLYLLRYIIP